MTYIDAHHDQEKDIVRVVERVNGKRQITELPPVYEFYYEDENGSHIATTGERCKLVSSKRNKDFKREIKSMHGRKTFEADQNIIFKTLKRHYPNQTPPVLNVAFFDIEVDFDLEKGYSTPEDPFNEVTAVSVYNVWEDTLYTLTIKPETLSTEEALAITSEFPNTVLCETENEMLMTFQDIIEEADVISGWNSEGYDVPYMVNRTIQQMNKASTAGWCLWGMLPVRTKVEKFGKENLAFRLKGRLHVDYLDLYQKHTPKTQESYKLDFIGLQEVNERKVEYDGTLYQLYREDFKKFIEYNRQDTMLLHKIDKKLQYLDLANQIAIQNWVLIPSTMGTVAWVDQSIINEAHERGMVVPTKLREEEQTNSAAGAWVAEPELGLQEWIGAVDINSLYPSCIRLLNMSPETIFGQIRLDHTDEYLEDRIVRENLIYSVKGVKKKNYTEAWNGLFGTLEYQKVIAKEDEEITVDWEDGTSMTLLASELYELIFQDDSNLNISANGTIFRTDIDGLIPGLLARWYNERKVMQKTSKIWKSLQDGITEVDSLYEAMLEEISEDDRQNRAGVWFAVDLDYAKKQFTFWNMRQQIRKIQLNSLYGSLLQKGSKFYDKRLGQSVTLTGRCITKHMTAKINETVTGLYDHTGDAIVYGDTDSLIGSTKIESEFYGAVSIEDYYKRGTELFGGEDLENMKSLNKSFVATVDGLDKVKSYDEKNKKPIFRKASVHRHKVSKPKWRLVTESGKEVIITDDHSLVVMRDEKLTEVKPSQVDPESDQVVSLL